MVANTIAPPFYKPEQLEMMRKLDEATARLRGSKSKLEMTDALRSVTHWHDALKESLLPTQR